MFRERDLYIYNKRTKEIKDITEKVKGDLILMFDGTSTVVNERIINTCEDGTKVFYPK